MCNMMLRSRRFHDVMLYLCSIFCFSSPSPFHQLPLPFLFCCPHHSTPIALHSITLLPPFSFLTLIISPHPTPHCTPSHNITLNTPVYAPTLDVKKKNGSDDGSEDAPPSPQKPVKGASKQTWGAKSKGQSCVHSAIQFFFFFALV